MYFCHVAENLPEGVHSFAERLSNMLEDMAPSLLDRQNTAVVLETKNDKTWIRLNLPHVYKADFNLHAYLENCECVIYFGDAHMHFAGEAWQDHALDFLCMLLLGHIEVRSIHVGENVVGAHVYRENTKGEWELVGIERYMSGLRFGKWHRKRECVGFVTEHDFDRLALREQPEDGIEYVALPNNTYFKKLPKELPPDVRRFFNLLNEQLEKQRPPLLDEGRTKAYWIREDGGYLCVSLPHKVEKAFYVGVDIYANRCEVFYGNGSMRLAEEDWIDAAGGMIGAILFGHIEVRSIYRGDHLNAVVTKFHHFNSGRKCWKRRFKRKWFGRRRIDVKRIDYFGPTKP